MSVATKERVLELLTSLGDTADDVAVNLQALGIRGDRGKSRCCPITLYLKSYNVGHIIVFPGCTIVESIIGATDLGKLECCYIYSIQHLSAVREFMRRFDGGAYPQCEVIQ